MYIFVISPFYFTLITKLRNPHRNLMAYGVTFTAHGLSKKKKSSFPYTIKIVDYLNVEYQNAFE